MKKPERTSLKNLLETNGSVTRKEFRQARDQLLRQVESPKVRLAREPVAAIGDQLSMRIKGYPLPIVDLYENGLKKDPDGYAAPFYAQFQGIHGPIRVECDYQEKSGVANATVPVGAINGEFSLIFTIKETLGPVEFAKQLLEANMKLEQDIRDYLADKAAVEKCGCNGGNKEDPGETREPEEYDYEPHRDRDRGFDRISHRRVMTARLFFECYGVFSDTCNICPHGAIRFRDHQCYVDTDICQGAHYRSDGNGRMRRTEESHCWDCFDADDENVSTRCLQRRLKKVLHTREYECCADCTRASLNPDNLLNLQESCPYDAILQVSNPRREGLDMFSVNKEACQGCFERTDINCFYNINCLYNTSASVVDREIRMVAHVADRPN